MGLETGTYVSDLVGTNPLAGDKKSVGDDHLRLIKNVLKTTFPNASKPFYFPRSVTKTADYTILSTDEGKTLPFDATSGNLSATLPTLTSAYDGYVVRVAKIDSSANTVTVVGTINGETNVVITRQYAVLSFLWTGTDWLLLPYLQMVAGQPNFVNLTVSTLLTLSSTSHMIPPKGTTAQRPGTATQGILRYNTTLDNLEFPDVGGTWRQPSLAAPVGGSFKNLVVKNNVATPNTKIDIDADEIIVTTSGGTAYRLLNVNLTIDAGTTGANGLDTGGLAVDTWYVVLVDYNPSTDTVAGLLVKDSNFPGSITQPSGYTAYARVARFRTDGSGNLYRIKQAGRDAVYAGTTMPRLMVGGLLGNISAPTWYSVAHANFVPSSASHIGLQVVGPAGQSAMAAPNSNYGAMDSNTHPPPLMISGPTIADSATGLLLIEDDNVYFASNSGLCQLYCTGWRDNL